MRMGLNMGRKERERKRADYGALRKGIRPDEVEGLMA